MTDLTNNPDFAKYENDINNLEKKLIDTINIKMCPGNKETAIEYINLQKEKVNKKQMKIENYINILYNMYEKLNF